MPLLPAVISAAGFVVVIGRLLQGDLAMENDTRQSSTGMAEIEREVPAGVLDLIALYESIEDIYVKATIASATMEIQTTTGNSANFLLQRGA